jgi:hypothetical protein
MAEKGMFVKFMSALKKHFKQKYPFVKQMDQSFDVSMPKSCTFYLGVSPIYQKHVILSFSHSTKPWRVGEVGVSVHISTDYAIAKNWNGRLEDFELFNDGLYTIPKVQTANSHILRIKYWCLKPTSTSRITDSVSDDYTEYWRPSSYDDDEIVINETIADVCAMLEQSLFRKAGFIE